MGVITKDATDRINETLQYLNTSNLLTNAERQAAHAFANQFIQNGYPATNSKQAGYKNFSEGMSMAKVHNAGHAEQRKMRRAIYLLWHAMGDAQKAARATQVGAGQVADEFRRTVQKALIVAGKVIGSDLAARNVLETIFRANPLEFLRHDTIMISGSTRTNAGPGANQNVIDFYFSYNEGQDRYEFQPNGVLAGAGSYRFDAVSVPAVLWANVPGRGNNVAAGNFSQIQGTELGGATVMVTTQFTGCSFCWKAVGGTVYAAHISPTVLPDPNRIEARTLAQQLCGQVGGVQGGDFANAAGAAPFRVYGREFGNGGFAAGYPRQGLAYMCIIGFLRNANWEIYSQHRFVDGHIAAYQLYP